MKWMHNFAVLRLQSVIHFCEYPWFMSPIFLEVASPALVQYNITPMPVNKPLVIWLQLTIMIMTPPQQQQQKTTKKSDMHIFQDLIMYLHRALVDMHWATDLWHRSCLITKCEISLISSVSHIQINWPFVRNVIRTISYKINCMPFLSINSTRYFAETIVVILLHKKIRYSYSQNTWGQIHLWLIFLRWINSLSLSIFASANGNIIDSSNSLTPSNHLPGNNFHQNWIRDTHIPFVENAIKKQWLLWNFDECDLC